MIQWIIENRKIQKSTVDFVECNALFLNIGSSEKEEIDELDKSKCNYTKYERKK